MQLGDGPVLLLTVMLDRPAAGTVEKVKLKARLAASGHTVRPLGGDVTVSCVVGTGVSRVVVLLVSVHALSSVDASRVRSKLSVGHALSVALVHVTVTVVPDVTAHHTTRHNTTPSR